MVTGNGTGTSIPIHASEAEFQGAGPDTSSGPEASSQEIHETSSTPRDRTKSPIKSTGPGNTASFVSQDAESSTKGSPPKTDSSPVAPLRQNPQENATHIDTLLKGKVVSDDTAGPTTNLIKKRTEEESQPERDSLTAKRKPVEKPKKNTEDVLPKPQSDLSNWLISVQGAPTFYSFISSGTPYGQSLSSGKVTTGLSMSYGVLLNIPLSEKLTFRLGYRRSNFAYSVKDATSGLANSGNGAILTDRAIQRNGNTIPSAVLQSVNSGNAFTLEQKMGHTDIPFEIYYTLKKGKITIDAIGGISVLFLGSNSITLKNEGGSVDIGSMKYLKKASFSPNVGLGLRYRLSERLRLDLEPTLRYQLNAFDGENRDLHPLIFGIYTGATLKL